MTTINIDSNFPARLAEVVRTYSEMSRVERESDAGLLLKTEIRTAGQVADFFGGFRGMQQLESAANEIDRFTGNRLNCLWDGIGGWCA